MELALSALVAAFVIAPGIAWRFSFWASPHAESQGPEEYTPFARSTLRLVLSGLVVQGIGIAVVHCCTAYEVRPSELIALLSGADQLQTDAVARLIKSFDAVAVYIVALVASTWFLGHLLRWLITHYRLDEPQLVTVSTVRWLRAHLHLPQALADALGALLGRVARWVRFDAPWTELLLNSSPALAFKMAYAVVKIGDQAFVYAGEVEKLHFDRNGALDRLLLKHAERWAFDGDEPEHDDLSLGYVVLPYAKIENLYVVDVIEEPEE